MHHEIKWSTLISLRVQICLSSVEFLCFMCRKYAVWFLYLGIFFVVIGRLLFSPWMRLAWCWALWRAKYENLKTTCSTWHHRRNSSKWATLSSTSWKTIPNSLETKSSFSSPLTKQRAITNWNRQHTTPSLNKQGFCRVFLSLKLKKYQIAPILHRDHRNCPVSGKGAIPVKFWIGVCLEMSETLTLFNDEAKDNCPNTTYHPLF